MLKSANEGRSRPRPVNLLSRRLVALVLVALALALAAGGALAEPAPPAPRAAEWAPRDVIATQFPVLFARFADVDGIAVAAVLLDGVAVEANVSGAVVRHVPAVALEPGPHRASVRVEDAGGRSAAVAWSFVVLPANVAGEAAFALAPLAHARAPAPLPISDAELGVTSVEIVPDETVANLTVGFTRLAGLPPSATPLRLTPLLLLGAHAAADVRPGFESVRISLSVPRQTLDAFGADAENLVPLAFRDGRWDVLEVERGEPPAAPGTVALVARSTGLHTLAVVADVQPPVVDVASPSDGAILREAPAVRVAAADDTRVDRVALTLDGTLVRARETRAEDAGASTILADAALENVPDGRHVLELRAFDVAGNVASRSWTFVLDRAPPTFPAAAPTSYAASAPAAIEIALSDSLGGVDAARVIVQLDGVDVTRDAEITPLSVRYAPPRALSPGEHVLTVRAHDRAGNDATFEHAFTVLAPAPALPLALALALVVAVALTRTAARRTSRGGGLPRP